MNWTDLIGGVIAAGLLALNIISHASHGSKLNDLWDYVIELEEKLWPETIPPASQTTPPPKSRNPIARLRDIALVPRETVALPPLPDPQWEYERPASPPVPPD